MLFRSDAVVSRRPRAADASQAASATSVFTPAPDRAHADRARENHRESAADSRKQARRPAQGARTAKRQGVTAISGLPNPRDARRNARIAPCRRAPGIGRTCTAHEATHSAYCLMHFAGTTRSTRSIQMKLSPEVPGRNIGPVNFTDTHSSSSFPERSEKLSARNCVVHARVSQR